MTQREIEQRVGGTDCAEVPAAGTTAPLNWVARRVVAVVEIEIKT